jgi:hypothetical protein
MTPDFSNIEFLFITEHLNKKLNRISNNEINVPDTFLVETLVNM